MLSVVCADGCYVLSRMVLQQRLRAGFMVHTNTPQFDADAHLYVRSRTKEEWGEDGHDK